MSETKEVNKDSDNNKNNKKNSLSKTIKRWFKTVKNILDIIENFLSISINFIDLLNQIVDLLNKLIDLLKKIIDFIPYPRIIVALIVPFTVYTSFNSLNKVEKFCDNCRKIVPNIVSPFNNEKIDQLTKQYNEIIELLKKIDGCYTKNPKKELKIGFTFQNQIDRGKYFKEAKKFFNDYDKISLFPESDIQKKFYHKDSIPDVRHKNNKVIASGVKSFLLDFLKNNNYPVKNEIDLINLATRNYPDADEDTIEVWIPDSRKARNKIKSN